MAKHAPRPIDRRDANVAMARAAADEASLDAWLAHLSAEAAHERIDAVEEAGDKTRKAVSEVERLMWELDERRVLDRLERREAIGKTARWSLALLAAGLATTVASMFVHEFRDIACLFVAAGLALSVWCQANNY